MLRFSQYLVELKFADLNPRTGEWKQIPVSTLKHAQTEPPENIDTELFALLDKSYAYIGGHVDFRKPSDLPANHTIWWGVDLDGDKKPDVVQFAKDTPYGTKWTGGATDGSPAAKAKYIDSVVTRLRTQATSVRCLTPSCTS
jgi:hypothetical protein